MSTPPPPPPPPPPPEAQRVKAAKSRRIRPRKPRSGGQKKTAASRPRKKGLGVKRIILITFLIVLVIILLTPILREALINWLNPLSYRTFPENVDFTVRRSISISSVSSYTVDVPEPPNIRGEAQQILDISSSPDYTTTQKYGGDWMVWEGPGEANIRATYHIRTKTIWWDIEESEVLSISDASKTNPLFVQLSTQYNHDEWRLQYEGTYIETLASQIAPGDLSVYEIAQRIYDYLDTHVSYSPTRTGEVKYPMETLQDGSGDCDDMSFLFASLLRSRGVPSWVELGAMFNSITNEWIGHAWLEFYLPTFTGGLNVTIDMSNHEFLVRGANRFSEWKSDGNGSHLEDYYYPYSYVSIGNPSIEDLYTTIDYSTDGTVVVKLGSDGGAIPGFDLLIVPVAVLVALVLKRQTRRK
ncbi:MAG: transglutaminase family protein [Thermoplasmata archaeon]